MTPPRTGSPARSAAQRKAPRRPAPAPDRRPPVLFIGAAAVGTFAALFALVTVNIMLQQAGVQRAGLEDRVREQRRGLEQLELEAARLRSPARIEEEALRLGLVPPSDVVVLSEERSRPAASATGEAASPSPRRGED